MSNYKDYHVTLNVGVLACDQDEAMEIADELKKVLQAHSPYKLRYVESDDIEED